MIKTKQLICFVLLLFTLPVSLLHAQSTETGTDPKIEEVRSLTQFFEYMLNAVGAKATTQRDKEVIITQSYQKAFVNNKVQVEDDLLDARTVITNKDITGYLRDVDFFFTNISFAFTDIDIQKLEKPNGEPYYLVSFENRLQGTTSEGEKVNKTQRRFLEVNYDVTKNDLKIVSVYTTKLTRKKELDAWWSSLSYDWIAIFQNHKSYQEINDSVIEQMTELDSLNLAGYSYLTDLSPLTMLKKLKFIDISDTRISDLRPIRYASELRVINANNTPISNIDVVSYLPMIKQLQLSRAGITDITPLANLTGLRRLDLSSANIADFSPLQHLTQLEMLDISNSTFSELSLIQNNNNLRELNVSRTNVDETAPLLVLKQIQTLNLSETGVTDLVGLKTHPSLQLLYINQTSISSLDALNGMKSLKKVFADYTKINPEDAAFFMKKNPSVLVISNSEEILIWWNGLSVNWRTVLTPYMDKNLPQKEAFMQLLNSDSLNLSGLQLNSGQALKRFKRLHYLNISDNGFNAFDFTADMGDLKVLIANNLPATNSMGLEHNTSLEKLVLKGSAINDIEALRSLPKLNYLDIDNANVPMESVAAFIQSSPGTVVLYRSSELQLWWDGLNDTWKSAFNLKESNSRTLHGLTQRQQLSVSGMGIQELTPLSMFTNLEELSLNQVNIVNFNGLSTHQNLKVLTCTNGPLQAISGLEKLQRLEEINVMNTAIDDLSDLRLNTALKRLNCSGTNLKKLRGFEYLKSIEFIDISNTGTFSLDRLYELKQLKKVICYNTRIRDYEVEGFRARLPDCEVVFY